MMTDSRLSLARLPLPAAPFARRALLVAAGVLVFTASQLAAIGLTWDEPFYFQKQYRLDAWYRQLLGSAEQRARALQPENMRAAWNFCRGVPHENPPLYAVLSHLTWRATRWLWGDWRGHRLAPALLFSLVAGIGFALAHERWGALAAWTFLGAWVVNPRLFAHARLATTDMTMTAFWFCAAVAFLHATEQRRHAWRFGLLWAFSFMSKATGVLALLPQLVWSLAYRQKFALRIFCWAALLAPAVAVLVHPGWWHDPVGGMRDAIEVHRHRHEVQAVKTYYLGKVYPHALPWHNTLVLTAACMPAAWLILALVGLTAAACGGLKSPVVGWTIGNLATLMIVRATPIAPGHDGIRQFLAAFPYFSLLAGYGMHCIASRLLGRPAESGPTPDTAQADVPAGAEGVSADRGSAAHFALKTRTYQAAAEAVSTHGGSAGRWRTFVPQALFAAALLSAGVGWWRIRPYELSFYSELIGGLPGAQRLGLETAYYWEAAGAETLDFLNRSLPFKARIGIPYELNIFGEYQRWGRLRADLVFLQEDKHRGVRRDYYLFLAREGLLTPTSRELLAGPALFEVRRQGVRLLVLIKV